jgi:hypothetical protein
MNGNPDTLQVFLSHKEIDHSPAKEIATALRRAGRRGVQVHYSGEREQFGQDFLKWIEDHLEQAEWYILAYTEPSKNWDWCLYEAGYFEACQRSRDNQNYRVICLHPDPRVPAPLKRFDPVPVNGTNEELERFCERYLGRVDPLLRDNPTEMVTERDNLAQGIREAFRNLVENRYYCRHITVCVPSPAALPPEDLPDDATIEGTNDLMSMLFNANGPKFSWSHLRGAPATKDRRWVVQLAHAVNDIHNDHVPQPITGTIEIGRLKASLLPVLSRVDEVEDHSYRCELLLADGITSRWAGLQRGHIRALLTSVRMAVRFRYDVIDRFANEVRSIIAELGPRRFRETLRNLMFDIITESQAHGLGDFRLMLSCFESESVRDEIAALFGVWGERIQPRLFTSLGMSPDPSVWTQFDDSPFEDDAIEEIERCLAELREANTRFLMLTLERFKTFIDSGDA